MENKYIPKFYVKDDKNKEDKKIEIPICKSNNQAIKSKVFNIIISDILKFLYGEEKYLKKVKLVMDLIQDWNLTQEEISEIDDIFFMNWINLRITNEFVEKIDKNIRKQLLKNWITIKNILKVITIKIIRKKLDFILWDNNFVDDYYQKNKKDNNKDLFWIQKFENDCFYIFQCWNLNYVINKKTKEVQKYLSFNYIKYLGIFLVKDIEWNLWLINFRWESMIPCEFKDINYDWKINWFIVEDKLWKKWIYKKIWNTYKKLLLCEYDEINYDLLFWYIVKKWDLSIWVIDKDWKIVFEWDYQELIWYAYKVGYLLKKNDKLWVLDLDWNIIKDFSYTEDNLRLINYEINHIKRWTKYNINKIKEYKYFKWRDINDEEYKFLIYMWIPFNAFRELFSIFFKLLKN